MSNCIVKDNRATGSFGGGFTGSSSGTFSYTFGGGTAEGGGLYTASGALTIGNSAVDDNLAQGGPGGATFSGGGASGGGVNSVAPLVLSNVTLAGNQAVGGTSTARGCRRRRWRWRRALLRCGDDHQHRFHG